MSEKFHYNELVTPPDFEVECDNFVSEIVDVVGPKYPELGIMGVNETKEIIQMSKSAEKILSVIFDQERIKYFRLKLFQDSADKEISSVTENVARVEITPINPRPGLRIKSPVKEIFELAEKHKGKLDPNKGFDGTDTDFVDLLCPEIYKSLCMHFVFQDQ